MQVYVLYGMDIDHTAQSRDRHAVQFYADMC